MKKTHVQIITLIMLMSVSTEYLQASSAQSAATAARRTAAATRQSSIKQAAQPAPSLWSRTKAATANMFGKSAKVAPEPAGGDTDIALGTPTAPSVTPAATTPGFAARFNTILNQKINPTKQVQDTETASNTDNSSVNTTNESSEGLSYYERAKAAASNAARVTGNALVTGAKNAYHAPGALVGAAGGDANFMTTAGKAVYNAPGKVSVALGGQQKIITGETGSLRSLSGYDKYSKDAVQGGNTWNFATKANQNYTKKTSDFMADNLETTSNGMVRAKPATNWLTAPNIETGQVTTPRPLKNPKPVKDTFLDSSNLGTAGGTLNPMRQKTSQNRPSNTAYTQGESTTPAQQGLVQLPLRNQSVDVNSTSNLLKNRGSRIEKVQKSLSRSESPKTVADFFDATADATQTVSAAKSSSSGSSSPTTVTAELAPTPRTDTQ